MASLALPKYRVTVRDFHKMGEARILPEDARVELIDGELITMAPIGSEHASVVRDLINILVPMVQGSALVDAQNPLTLGEHSEPQPDLMVLRGRLDGYRQSHPRAEDVLLLIEVADSSAATDRNVKIPLYAKHGVREVWLIDLGARVLEVYREPQSRHGDYRSVERLHGGTVTARHFSQISVELSTIFP